MVGITLLNGWSLNISMWRYLAICVLATIVVRVVHSAIKALSVVIGKPAAGKAQKGISQFGNKQTSFVKCFLAILHGFKKGEFPDLWLGTIIGFAEIASYPVLIFTDNLSVIGGWLVIKTAGQWKMWQDSPIDFNRFLLANLINLAIAYFFIIKFVQQCVSVE
jgi:hypothetical protein